MSNKTQVIVEMETGDIDDVLTLIWMLLNPKINILCICVVPGSPAQIGLIQTITKKYNKNIPIGCADEKSSMIPTKSYHTIFNYDICEDPIPFGYELINKYNNKDVTLFTIGPIKSAIKAIQKYPKLEFSNWVGQGGFAGVGVVPTELIMDKFKNQVTCATFNFGSKADDILQLLKHVKTTHLVSKNVCHRFLYTEEFDKIIPKDIQTIMQQRYGDDLFTKQKAMHDLLAVVSLVDKSAFEFREVELFMEKRQWGSKLKTGSNVFISVDYHQNNVYDVLSLKN